MSYASNCPAAITGLLQTFNGSVSLTGVLITDGIPISDTSADEVVTVGYTSGDTDTAAEGSVTPEDYDGVRGREQYGIHCAVAVRNSDGDTAAARVRVFALFGACGQAIGADTRLGGAVMSAAISSWQLSAEHPADVGGVLVVIQFDVSADAFTSR